jgi:hypothetical protein
MLHHDIHACNAPPYGQPNGHGTQAQLGYIMDLHGGYIQQAQHVSTMLVSTQKI